MTPLVRMHTATQPNSLASAAQRIVIEPCVVASSIPTIGPMCKAMTAAPITTAALFVSSSC